MIRIRRAAAGFSLLGTFLCAGVAALLPQGARAGIADVMPPEGATPALFSMVDPQNVDLATGNFSLEVTDVIIGQPNAGGLSYGRTISGMAEWERLSGSLTVNDLGSAYYIQIDGETDTFTTDGGVVFKSAAGKGSALTRNGTTFTYTMSDGTVVIFDAGDTRQVYTNYTKRSDTLGYYGRITSMTLPNGEVRRWVYNFSGSYGRLQSVSNNFGYQIRFQYQSDQTGNTGDASQWLTRTGVVGFNMAYENCAPEAISCTLGSSWPRVQLSETGGGVNDPGITDTVADALGRTTRYVFNGPQDRLTAIQRAAADSHDITIEYEAGQRVKSVSNGVGTWNYSYSVGCPNKICTTTVTDPLGNQRVVTSDVDTHEVLTDRDALYHTVTNEYDLDGHLTKVTQPEGDYITYEYDSRGNIKKTTKYGKPGSGLVAWSESTYEANSAYADGCSNRKICNKPSASHDDNGHWTYYAYDSTHGGVTTVTLESPGNGQAQPQTRYSYSSFQARYQNGSGWVSGSSIYLLTGTSTCLSGSSCGGAATEAKTSIAYGDTGQANNLLPISVTKSAGNGAVSASTTLTYDVVGNKLTETGPANTGTTRYRYDAARQVVGVVGPAAGVSGKYRAIAVTYNADGQVTETRQGTVSSQSDDDWNNHFVTLQKATVIYDGQGRKIWDVLKDPNDNELVTTGYGYDAANRLLYAVRPMGTTGADRGTNYTYDVLGRVTQVDGNGQVIATTSYTANGQKASVGDGKGNVTNYSYDGFNRVSTVIYPAVNGTSSNETYNYNNDSNVTAHRQRDGQTTVSLTRDALERVTAQDVGGYSYSYDNLGHVTQVMASGRPTVTMEYDALGRVTSQTTDGRKVSAQYDAAGRLSQLTWPDGSHADYSYDATGAMTDISVNGTWVQGYSYDDFGRRQSATRANGVTTSYGFDSASRLTSLGFGGSTSLSLTFSYNRAGQILTRSSSNTAYDPPAPTNGTTNYTNNELNQTTALSGPTGSSGLTYDGRGNLSAYGSTGLGYNADNQLTSVSTGTNLSYDPMGRLYQVSQSSTTRFLYFGSWLIAEYDTSGNVLRRYVPGAATDETAVWYEGSSIGTDSARWLIPDERGSVVAVTNSNGNALAINTYDEYGRPGSGNMGRFQYTGQAYLAEIGAYYYKARVYIPSLGKFAQTDPSGYGAGMNLYAYVGEDPINNTDPTGLVSCNTQPQAGFDGVMEIQVCADRPRSPTPTSQGGGNGGGQPQSPQQEKQPQKQRCPSIQEYREHHDEWVAKKVEHYLEKGYAVSTEISLRVYSQEYPDGILARADIGYRPQNSNIVSFEEIKTGDARLSKGQRVVYNAPYAVVVGNRGNPLGLLNGELIPLGYVPITRCPGLGS